MKFIQNLPNLPSFDHLGSSLFSLDSGNVPPLLLRGRWQNIYWSHNRKHKKKYDLTYFLSIIRDTYFTAISLELSPEQGMTSVSVYLRNRGQEIEQRKAKTFKMGEFFLLKFLVFTLKISSVSSIA